MNLDKGLEVLEKAIITLGLGAATLLLFANVVARYVFHSGFTWVLELVQYLFAWVVLVGAAHGFRVGSHLGIDILVEKFSPAMQRRIALLAVALCLLFVGLVFWYSIQYTLRIHAWGDLTLDLQIPQWIPYLAIPVGLGLMFLHLLQVGWDIIQGRTLRIHANEAADALKQVEDI
ncbi:TRAP transporter small permease [Thiolapillus sp.]